jgi:hypothetical protein
MTWRLTRRIFLKETSHETDCFCAASKRLTECLLTVEHQLAYFLRADQVRDLPFAELNGAAASDHFACATHRGVTSEYFHGTASRTATRAPKFSATQSAM